MRLISLLILGALGWLLIPGAWAGEAKSSGGHSVRWDAGLEAMGQDVLRRLPAVRKQVEEALGFPFPGGPAEVLVVRGHERMKAESSPHVPDWAAGVCVGSRSRIVLRADRVEGNPLNPMVATLRHEWVHLAWSRRAGLRTRALPLWFEEGLAERVGGGVSVEAGAQLDFAASFGWLLDFDDVATSWPPEASRASLAYKQGRSFVEFFEREHGVETLRAILGALADGKDVNPGSPVDQHFDQVVFAKTGSRLGYWVARWKTDVEEHADPWFHLLLRDFTWTIFILISIVALFGFYFFHRRRQRQIAELPDHPMPGELY